MNQLLIIGGKRLRNLVTGILAIGMLASFTSLTAQQSAGYLNFKDLSAQIKSMVQQHDGVANLESIGKSAQGRDIWLITLANPKGTPLGERPGILVAANFEGDHLVGSQISLSMMKSLLEDYSDNEDIKKSFDEHVYYFFPRMNPDGAEQFFNEIKTGQKTNSAPYDGDNDGRMDEDGPDDLDNNGVITMMRVKDPAGSYTIDPANDQILKVADATKGETGMYKVYWEGLDNDGDGFINEDPVGGVDFNRNFQHAYPYFQPDAGLHMICENETKALMDWVISHRNISIMLNFGLSDNLLTAPNSKGQLSNDRGLNLVSFADASISGASKVGMVSTRSSFGFFGRGGFSFGGNRSGQTQQSAGSRRQARKPATTYNKADLSYFTKVSEEYKELTGLKKAPILRNPQGAFFQYGYFQYGVLSLSTPGWGFPEIQDSTSKREGPKRGASGMSGRGPSGPSASKSGIDQEYMKYLMANNVKGFVAWKSFEHPDLGQVEIGGFTPYEMVNPKADLLDELGQKHADFVVYLSSLYADISIVNTEVISHGDGLFRIKASVENKGFLPTTLQHGVVSRSVAPAMVQLGVQSENIISGDSKTNFIQRLEGSGDQKSFEWLLKGKKGDKIELKVHSQKGGTDKAIITLQ
ncbi:MAG: hypothetical protein HOG34_18025 [Bacteroidetes bacterium]|nr:hypothetical protein [Bacteroidota bacterium]